MIFDAMDRQDHASNFVNQTGLETHQKQFDDPNIIYLSIDNSSGELSGYFVLVVEPDTGSLEFRRILLDQTQRGTGQVAIKEMENYCKSEFSVTRIWLDVYEDNDIGRHIYEKMGYRQFKAEHEDGRKLLFYEKAF
ncbi:MAG: GNAT family N-acetyltransferase [Pseudomonadales bacterium]|nr:GNAT family N-acetyltransferase [Woeseia sp.]RZV49450.1 MAG: GNAT family N-acetyltransferase [Pseudomonadales bacterium]